MLWLLVKLFWERQQSVSKDAIHPSYRRPTLVTKGSHAWLERDICGLTIYVICCFEWGYRTPTLVHIFPEIYTQVTTTRCLTKIFRVLRNNPQKTSHTPSPKSLLYCFRKGKITVMEKGKSIQVELRGEELQRNIEQIRREIQEVKEEGIRVEATSVYKAATSALDEDLGKKWRRRKTLR